MITRKWWNIRIWMTITINKTNQDKAFNAHICKQGRNHRKNKMNDNSRVAERFNDEYTTNEMDSRMHTNMNKTTLTLKRNRFGNKHKIQLLKRMTQIWQLWHSDELDDYPNGTIGTNTDNSTLSSFGLDIFLVGGGSFRWCGWCRLLEFDWTYDHVNAFYDNRLSANLAWLLVSYALSTVLMFLCLCLLRRLFFKFFFHKFLEKKLKWKLFV